MFPLSYTLDHCGPLSWTVEDSAIAMEVIAGFDPLDPASADVPVPDFRGKLGHGVQGLRLGLPRHWFVKADGASAETLRGIDDAAQTLAKLGATIEEIELPDYELYNACGRVIMLSEAYAIHEKDFQTRPLDYGLYTYLRMSHGRVRVGNRPHAGHAPAPRAGAGRQCEAEGLRCADHRLHARRRRPRSPSTIRTARRTSRSRPCRSTSPAIRRCRSRPASRPSGLPLSMQIVGRAFDEPTVLGIGAAFEAATNLHVRRPSFDVAKAA